MDKENILQEAAAVIRDAYSLRMQYGTGGNFSLCFPESDRVYIKQSGISFEDSQADNLVETDLSGDIKTVGKKPSSELPTHLAIYRSRPEVRAIFHNHYPLAIAYGADHDSVPALAYHIRKKFGDVPVIDTGDDALIPQEMLAELLKKDICVFIHARHGIFSFGKTMKEARYYTEFVMEMLETVFYRDLLAGNLRK